MDEVDRNYNQNTKEKLDKVTRLLCSVMTYLTPNDRKYLYSQSFGPELKKWWDSHQEQDRKRTREESIKKAKEEFKKKTLAKLTKEEKKILGL